MLQLTKKCLNPASRKLVYYGRIHSHLTYCLMVWGSLGKKCDITRLIKAQNKCVKLIDPAIELSMIYKKYRILKLAKMIQLQEIKFGFKQINQLLPT